MSYAACITVCVAYGVWMMHRFRADRAYLEALRRAERLRLLLRAAATTARISMSFTAVAEAARQATIAVEEFHKTFAEITRITRKSLRKSL